MSEMAELRQALENMSASADLERLKGMDAIILFDVGGADGGVWTVTVDDGDIAVEEGETGTADVTVKATSDDLLALVKGELNPMAAFMTGRLKVKGDMSIAMQLQKLFAS